MKLSIVPLCILIYGTTYIYSQPSTKVGGPCQGCEAVFDYGGKKLSPIDTLPGFYEHKQKIKIYGTVFQKDEKAPAKNVIIYIYHTNEKGIYEKKGDETGFAKYHGIHRGWVKTDDEGRYSFYTFKPGSYPNGTEPAHIHFTIKEPDKNEYYIESIQFDDDPLLSKTERKKRNPRGGYGIVKLVKEGDLLVAKRDITLGLNIPYYE